VSERDRPQSPPPSEQKRHSWDTAAIANTLSVPAEARLDPLHGKGARLSIGEPPALELELFPAAQIIRLSTPDLSLNLVQEQTPILAADGVIFDAPQRSLVIAPSGDALLRIRRAKPVQTPSAPVDHAEESMTQDGAADGLLDDLAALDEGSGPTSPAPRQEGKETQQERIKVFGRLATNVRFKTLRNERLVGEFVLAERIDEEQTKFHKVAAFDNPEKKRQLATELKALVDAGEIAKDQAATVVGYRHQVERNTQGGGKRLEEQLFAVAIKPR